MANLKRKTATIYDGSSFCEKGTGGFVNSKLITLSVWVKFGARTDGQDMHILSSDANHFELYRASNNYIYFTAKEASGSKVFRYEATGNEYTESDGWLNILISGDATDNAKCSTYDLMRNLVPSWNSDIYSYEYETSCFFL